MAQSHQGLPRPEGRDRAVNRVGGSSDGLCSPCVPVCVYCGSRAVTCMPWRLLSPEKVRPSYFRQGDLREGTSGDFSPTLGGPAMPAGCVRSLEPVRLRQQGGSHRATLEPSVCTCLGESTASMPLQTWLVSATTRTRDGLVRCLKRRS